MSGTQRALLALDGELTAPHANAQRERLLGWLAANEGGEVYTLDLSQIAEMDTSGAQLLLALSREAEARSGALQILNPSHAVVGVLSTYRLLTALGLQNTQESAA